MPESRYYGIQSNQTHTGYQPSPVWRICETAVTLTPLIGTDLNVTPGKRGAGVPTHVTWTNFWIPSSLSSQPSFLLVSGLVSSSLLYYSFFLYPCSSLLIIKLLTLPYIYNLIHGFSLHWKKGSLNPSRPAQTVPFTHSGQIMPAYSCKTLPLMN